MREEKATCNETGSKMQDRPCVPGMLVGRSAGDTGRHCLPGQDARARRARSSGDTYVACERFDGGSV